MMFWILFLIQLFEYNNNISEPLHNFCDDTSVEYLDLTLDGVEEWDMGAACFKEFCILFVYRLINIDEHKSVLYFILNHMNFV